MGIAERRERERQQRRNEILDAAERVFFRGNPADATMDDVAAEAELSKGTLYLYFKNKDDLYVALAVRSLSMLLDRVAVIGECQHGSGLRRLQQLGAIRHAYSREHPDHLRAILAWMAAGFRADSQEPGFAAYQECVQRMMSLVRGVVEEGKRDGSIRADVEPAEVVLHLWGGGLGVSMLYLNRDEIRKRVDHGYDFDRLMPNFSRTYLRAIASDPTELDDGR